MRVRLYRCVTKRDKDNNYILTSKEKRKLTNKEAFEEIVSHELNASTGRGVFYSFSTSIDLVKEYKKRNPENMEICFIDIDLDEIHPSILGVYPVYLRDYLLCLAANTPEVLELGGVKDPVTNRKHSLLGIINCSQRTVSGWAFSMREVMIQSENLRLEVWNESENSPEESGDIDAILFKHFAEKPTDQGIEAVRKIINETYNTVKLKRNYMRDRVVDTDDWFIHAA